MSIDGPSDVNNQGLIHINTNNLEVINRSNHNAVRSIRLLTTATIKFNGFAIMQFIEGADLVLNANKTISTVTLLNLTKLVIKLTRAIDAELAFSYEELCILRSWLEARMHHCEQERDARTPALMTKEQREQRGYVHTALKFNPDTYIGQKFLLLDLRELLLGEILSESINPKSL